MSYLVIRARSDRGVTRKIRETMSMLNLTRVNHATIVMDNPSYRGMLQKSKDYITWGEVDANTIEKLIKERGRMSGDKPVTDAVVKESSNFLLLTKYDSVSFFNFSELNPKSLAKISSIFSVGLL